MPAFAFFVKLVGIPYYGATTTCIKDNVVRIGSFCMRGSTQKTNFVHSFYATDFAASAIPHGRRDFVGTEAYYSNHMSKPGANLA